MGSAEVLDSELPADIENGTSEQAEDSEIKKGRSFLLSTKFSENVSGASGPAWFCLAQPIIIGSGEEWKACPPTKPKNVSMETFSNRAATYANMTCAILWKSQKQEWFVSSSRGEESIK